MVLIVNIISDLPAFYITLSKLLNYKDILILTN